MRDLSNWAAGVNILKGLIGLGVLTLPYATKQVGWLPSIIGMAVVAAMTVAGILYAAMAQAYLRQRMDEFPEEDTALVKEKELCEKMGSTHEASENSDSGMGFFDQTCQHVLGWPGRMLCKWSIALSQLGTAVAYITVVANSMQTYFGDHIWIYVVLDVLLIAFSLVKTLRGISYLSVIALLIYLIILVGLLCVTVQLGMEGTLGTSAAMVQHHDVGFGKWFGVVSFAFGAFAVAIVVHDDMIHPECFQSVTIGAFAVCWAFYSVFAILGYLCYGEATKDVIYFNFERGGFMREGTLISVCIMLVLSYILQMVPVFQAAERFAKDWCHYSVVRAAIITMTVIFGYICPNTSLVMTIVGALTAAITAFILPPIIYLKVKPQPTAVDWVLCTAVLVLGFVCGIKATIPDPS